MKLNSLKHNKAGFKISLNQTIVPKINNWDTNFLMNLKVKEEFN